MMTRATVGGVRVVIESYMHTCDVTHTCGVRWQWSTDAGRLVMGFVTSRDAYKDAQAAFDGTARIVQHKEPELPK